MSPAQALCLRRWQDIMGGDLRKICPKAWNHVQSVASATRVVNPALAAVLAILGITIVLMVTERLRPDLAALLMAMALGLVGVITPQEAFSGFSQSAVLILVAIYVMTQGLARTGVTRYMGLVLQKLSRDSLPSLVFATMVSGAGLSLFMTNVAAAAILMPAVMDLARRARVSPSKLMMPLAFSVNLGGMATLFATSNILVKATLRQSGLEPLGLLDLAPTGLPLAAIGIAFMVLVGRRLLPSVSKVGQFDQGQQPNLAEAYALEERLTQVRIDDSSPLVGRTIGASRIGENLGLNVLAVHPADQSVYLAPGPDRVLAAGDTVLVAGRSDRVQELAELGARVLESPEWNGDLLSDAIGFVEAIPAPRGGAAGRTLKDLRFRERYGLNVVAIWRGGRSHRTDVGDISLHFGDALLLYGGRMEVDVLRADPDFLVLSEPVVAPRTGRGWLAAAILLLALVAAGLNLLSLAQSMMLGALAMVLVGCLTMEEAYRSIEWRVIFLVAGMLPIGIALSNSGAADWIGQLLVTGLGGVGLRAVLAGLMLLAVVLSQFIPGQVSAAVLAPIAIAVATRAGANPYAFAIGVAAGCSMVYVTPVSHAVNMLVAGPGGYRFRDFFRAGLPLAALMYVAALIIVPLVWPLAP